MNVATELKKSSARLSQIEKKLDIERNNLIQHPSNNASLSSNSTYFPYLASVDKYAGFADKYVLELAVFKDLLQKTVTLQKNNSNTSAIDNETISHLPTNINLSCPVINPKIEETYTNDSNTSSLSPVTPRNTTDSNIIKSQNTIPISEEKTLKLPKVQPFPQKSKIYKKTIKAKIINRISYKYEQKGFDIWKRNGQRAIYSMTELYCSKTFGDGKFGIVKLKKFLIEKGGFKGNTIENIKILKDSNNNKTFGLITVRNKQENVIDCMNKINGKRNLISIYKRRSNQNRKQNKILHVKNFDILSGKDHKKLTDLFLRFGELETHVFINKDRLGNVYAFVQFSDIKDAIECERNQNSYYSNPLWINARKLQIEYAGNKTKNNKNNGKTRNYNSRK